MIGEEISRISPLFNAGNISQNSGAGKWDGLIILTVTCTALIVITAIVLNNEKDYKREKS